MRRRATLITVVTAAYALFLAGCPKDNGKQGNAAGGGGGDTPGNAAPVARVMHGVTINEQALLDDPPRPMAAARNETASTTIQLSNLPKPDGKSSLTLRLQPFQHQGENAQIDLAQVKVYQVLPMPVDANRAGYVRHTGLKAASRTMPRALLPVPHDNGKVNVAGLRDPSEPLNPNSRVGNLSKEPVLLWIDVAVPPTAKPGQYATTAEVTRDGQRLDGVPLSLNVYGFVLPDERHLHMVGRIEWDSLEALYPDLFEAVSPQLMKRNDPKYEQAIKLLDQLVTLAHEHRTSVVVPRLQPVVKWPANAPPQVDWTEFDSITEPWLSGAGFADKVPVGYWPLPRTDYLDRYPVPLQMQYWRAAASHFDQNGWLERAWTEVEKDGGGRAKAQESVKLSGDAAEILRAHPRIRVSLPLEEGQLQFADDVNPKLIDPQATDRVMAAASGLVYAPAAKPWPQGVSRPARWLRTDLPGLVPYIGAGGDERDVRLWAWHAYRSQGQVIGWDGALPHSKSPQQPADPNELTWFYPGRWFGVDEPVPTIQLKWLRRAQQDYEYLFLARQRGQVIYSLVMARLMVKPVQTRANEEPDPTHGLLSGTTDPRAWERALELLARNILLREPGKEIDRDKEAMLNTETQQWIAPQDKPLQIARGATWGWAAKQGNWVDLRLGLDIYNASDQPLTGDLEWVSAPRGWEFNPQPVNVNPASAVSVFQVKPVTMEAWVDLSRLGPETRKPIQLKFTDAMRKRPSYLTAVVPVAASDRREGQLAIDAALDEWSVNDDAVHTGPLTVMLDRVNVQKQQLQPAATESLLFSNWAAKNFYLAFKLDGLADGNTGSRVEMNDVEFQLRRAWGSDLCEVLIQPVYLNDVGHVIHLACKPRGQVAIRTKPSPKNQKLFGKEWTKTVVADVRYATAPDGGTWRGELAIPWTLINDKDHQGMRPTLLRFNFVQYKQATGESSSWAGPVDYGQDEGFMGLLYLRDVKAPGMGPRE